MGRPKKCLICGKSILDPNDMMPYKDRYVHKDCFNIGIKAITMNKQDALSEAVQSKEKKQKKEKVVTPKIEKLQDAVSEEEYEQKKKYYTYLKTLIGDEVSSKIYAVTKKQMDMYGFTYGQMYQTLVYLNEILEKDLKGDVIGLIPYYYKDATKYYEDIERIKKKNINMTGMYEKKIVYIAPKIKKNKLLDIDSIN